MSGNNEETQCLRLKMLQNIDNHEEITQGFGHFFIIYSNEAIVQPVVHEGMAASAALGLSNFVLVMRENQIAAAAVEVEGFTQIFHAHSGAFDVPARAAIAPGARPGGFAGFSRFPQSKVHGVLLAVVHIHASTSHHILDITSGQLTIMLKFFYAVENVAVHYISITIIN